MPRTRDSYSAAVLGSSGMKKRSERISPSLNPAIIGTAACSPRSNVSTICRGSTQPSMVACGSYPASYEALINAAASMDRSAAILAALSFLAM